MKLPKHALLCAAIAATAALPAHAALLTYSNKATFLVATASTDASGASGAYPNLGYVGPAPRTFGSVSVGGVSPMWVGALGFQADWTPLLPGNDLAFDGIENFNVVTAAPVYSLGFDIVEPSFIGIRNGGCGTGISACKDSTFSVTLLTSASVVVGSVTFNAPDNVATFVGVTSTTPFSKAQVREVVGGIENEYIGHFYTGNAPVTAVPEPGSNALLLGGLAGVAALMRRRLGAAQAHTG